MGSVLSGRFRIWSISSRILNSGDRDDRVGGAGDEQAAARGAHHPVLALRCIQPVRARHSQQGTVPVNPVLVISTECLLK